MYDVSTTRIATITDGFEPGTNLLIAGRPMVGKRNLTLELLTAGHGNDSREGILLVMTGESAMVVIEDLDRSYTTPPPELIGVVDCSDRDVRESIEGQMVRSLTSPRDLTGIGVSTAKLFRKISEQNVSKVRHGFISISTLLQYLDIETVFKFLHIYTRRISDTDGFGVFTYDPTAYDTQTLNTLTRLFDGTAELRKSPAGERELRLTGLERTPDTWQSI